MSLTGPPRAALVWFSLGIVYVIWGSTYLGIRVVVESLPAFGSAALRFAVAGVVLGAVLALRRGIRTLRVSPRQLGAAALVGVLLLAGGNGLVVLAESPSFKLPSGIAALLISLAPLLLAVLRLTTGDRPRVTTIVGVLIGLAGLVLLFLPGVTTAGITTAGITTAGDATANGAAGGHAIPIAGGLIVLVAVVCWSVGSFATRWLPMPADPFVASVWEMLAGAAAMAVIAVVRREPPPWSVPDVPAKAWLALAYLIVFGSLVAFTAYVWLLHHAPISLVATYAYVNPVIALALGALLVGEALTPQVLLAAATVVVGVMLVVSTERPRAPADVEFAR
jgi:drug/metabolite transporter (DMT)-like permease